MAKANQNPGPNDKPSSLLAPNVVDGGRVVGHKKAEFIELPLDPAPGRLAALLIIVWFVSFAGHYSAMFYLVVIGKTEAAAGLERLFYWWLVPLTGFTGAVVRYYFQHRPRRTQRRH
ncbi:MAG: hypothetical protein IH602_01060 [Bryobacteraceae bacterium]|nr:hypothetical protein [Bryobacteraceae bacterium]